MCAQTGYCRAHGVDHEVWGDEPMTCERAQQIRARLTAHAPTADESAEFWADEPVERASGNATRGQESRSRSGSGSYTSVVSQAVRSPYSHSKPQVRRMKTGEWFLDLWDCCPNRAHLTGLDIVDRITGIIAFDTQPEALAAALAHVREVHTGTVTLEIAPDFSGWHDALQTAHNESREGC